MLGVLASYSITVKELKLLFGAMKAVNGKWVSINILTFWYYHSTAKLFHFHSWFFHFVRSSLDIQPNYWPFCVRCRIETDPTYFSAFLDAKDRWVNSLFIYSLLSSHFPFSAFFRLPKSEQERRILILITSSSFTDEFNFDISFS